LSELPFELSELPFGLIDLPEEQRQHPVAWRLGGSHLAVAGGPRSGRTTVLRSLAQAASTVAGPGTLHVYVIDGSGALARLQGSPQVEAVVPVHDTERAGRLLRRISREIGRRQARIGAGGVHPNESTTSSPGSKAPPNGSTVPPNGSTVPAHDTTAPPNGSKDAPDDSKVVLLIDGWETLSSTWMDVDHGRLIDELISVLRDGPAVGVQAAISGGRSLLTGAVSTLLAERVVLRFADPADALLAGVPAAKVMGTGAVSAHPVGRGLFLSPDYPTASEIQVAIAPESGHCDPPEPGPADTTEPGLAVTGPARDLGKRSRWRIPELPQRLDYDELLAALLATSAAQTTADHAQCRDSPSPRILTSRQVPIGIGGDDAVPLHLDLDEAPVTLLIGPPGSGRTSALRCIAAGLRRSGEPVLSVSGRPDRDEELALALAKYPEATVLVDDIRVAGSPGDGRSVAVGELLVAWGGRLIIASTASDVLAAYRGILAVGRTARSGLILGNPAPGDGEVFGVRLSRRPPGLAGRALLVQAGQVSPVQLALPPVAGATPAASSGP
jgi:S-DNA-T family DNA segregation ATPase FtsK/SpoIIIE